MKSTHICHNLINVVEKRRNAHHSSQRTNRRHDHIMEHFFCDSDEIAWRIKLKYAKCHETHRHCISMANDSYQTSFISRHDTNCEPINWKSLKINLFQLKLFRRKIRRTHSECFEAAQLHSVDWCVLISSRKESRFVVSSARSKISIHAPYTWHSPSTHSINILRTE